MISIFDGVHRGGLRVLRQSSPPGVEVFRGLLLLFLLVRLQQGGEVQSRLLQLCVRSLCHHVTLTCTQTAEKLVFTYRCQHLNTI